MRGHGIRSACWHSKRECQVPTNDGLRSIVPRNILSVGIEIPGDQAEYTRLDSKVSPVDYDVSIIDPAISNFGLYPDRDYKGKRCLSESNSFRLKEQMEHWRREILEAVKAGKTVFLLLNDMTEVYVATGDNSYSGTGPNRHATTDVVLYNNYKIIPEDIDIVALRGKSMKLVDKDSVLTSYWAQMAKFSEYRVIISGQRLMPLVATRSGSRLVSAYLRYENTPGALVLLPYVEFDRDEFTREEDGEEFWTDEAESLGKRWIEAIVGIDKALRERGETTPPPPWATQDRYLLPKEGRIREELETIEDRIQALQTEKKQLEQSLADETVLRRLVYEKGKPLEAAIVEALKLLGFEAHPYRDSKSEFDVVFESGEGRLIGEAEGKDNRPINIDKLRQLDMNIHEDFARDNVDEMAKGVLIGNAYRLTIPEDRDEFFTQKCLTAAHQSNTALIRSLDLFKVAAYLSGKKDAAYARRCRQAILRAVGFVDFPDLPEELGLDSDDCSVSDGAGDVECT